ncbi:MAG: DNA repair protein RecN [Brumimicrobium sp.]|nr:DNA repair protein RecN [Brumimicrobium sp.]
MLKKLLVSNFALIQNAVIDFEQGFTVITGETGSGKSILLGALKLILGERADYGVIRDESEKTVVEAAFHIEKLDLAGFFEDNDLDYWKETILRREISAGGKSRAFVNDTPVQLVVLKDLTEKLIHIHSQHHTLELKNKSYQLNLLDTLADNSSLLKELKIKYHEFISVGKELEQLEKKRSAIELESEFNRFQLDEILKLQPEKRDFESIENEVQRGEQFEEIKSAYQLISEAINGDQGIKEILSHVKKNSTVKDLKINELLERLEAVRIELDDIAAVAEDDLGELDFDPGKINEYIVLLDTYNGVMRKHNLREQKELIDLKNRLSDELEISDNIEDFILKKRVEMERLQKEAITIAENISDRRKKTAPLVESDVREILTKLKLNGAFITFEITETRISETGIDEVAVLFTPNKGLQPQRIEKAASGGELSRLMLVIQYLLSRKKSLPTVIFDEIDTGVSGEVAQKIGEHLREMGNHMQLMAITHLPQVAGKGTSHIRVDKREEGGTTKTLLTQLNKEERIEEIAKLMSGSEINSAAIENAKNLMTE